MAYIDMQGGLGGGMSKKRPAMGMAFDCEEEAAPVLIKV